MKVKRRPVIYDAWQSDGGFWFVKNTLTGKTDTLTSKQFKEQFEETRDFEAVPKKKYEPKQYPQLMPIMDEHTGEILGFKELPRESEEKRD